MLPALVSGAAPLGVLAFVVVCGSVGIALWIAERLGRLGGDRRRPAAVVLALGGIIGFALAVWSDAGDRPEAYLLLAAALLTSVAALPIAWLRRSMQASVLTIVVWSLVAADRPMADVVFATSLLLCNALLVGAFVRRMRSTRRAAVRAGAEARNRAELLEVVRALPGSSVPDAAAVVCRTLRSLGFDGAGVTRMQAGMLVQLDRSGSVPQARPRPPERGAGWSAIANDRTVVQRGHDPGGTTAADLGGGPSFAASIAAPVKVDERPIAAVVGVWNEPHDPTDAEIEIVEVLASHLGGVMAAQERVARQSELLERLGALDRMRRGLLDAVSDEVRDPLTIIRGAGQILASHAERVAPEQRLALLERMCTQAADLRGLIDVLLDFSRSQSRRHDPSIGPTELADLLRDVSASTGASVRPSRDHLVRLDLVVDVDVSLVRSALELLLSSRPTLTSQVAETIVVEPGGEAIALRIGSAGSTPARHLVISLAAQLLEAGGATIDIGEALIIHLRRTGSPTRDGRPVTEPAEVVG